MVSHHWSRLYSWFCHICTPGLGSCSVTHSWWYLWSRRPNYPAERAGSVVRRGCICSTLRFRWVVRVRVHVSARTQSFTADRECMRVSSSQDLNTQQWEFLLNGELSGVWEPQVCKGPSSSEFQPAYATEKSNAMGTSGWNGAFQEASRMLMVSRNGLIQYLLMIPSGPWRSSADVHHEQCIDVDVKMYVWMFQDTKMSQNRPKMESTQIRPQILYMEAAGWYTVIFVFYIQ